MCLRSSSDQSISHFTAICQSGVHSIIPLIEGLESSLQMISECFIVMNPMVIRVHVINESSILSIEPWEFVIKRESIGALMYELRSLGI